MKLKNIEKFDKLWIFLDGSKRSVVVLDTIAIGKGEYLPGWKWSEHVGAKIGKSAEAHIGYILSGKMVIKSVDGKEVIAKSGDAFEVGPRHDAWVIGNETCVALDFEHLDKK